MGARAQGSSDAAAIAPPSLPLQPLTDADVRRHIGTHGLAAQLLPRPADLKDEDVIKSLVFTAQGRPVLVVMGLSSKVSVPTLGLDWSTRTEPVRPMHHHRRHQHQHCHHCRQVDERKLAAHLGVARRQVRLAPTDDALLHSGYAVGTVPPFGEEQRFRAGALFLVLLSCS